MTRRPARWAARRAAGVASLVACLALAACTSAGRAGATGPGTPAPLSTPQQVETGRIDVDTPALRAIRKDAGIAACTPGRSTNRLPALTLPCLGGGRAVALRGLRGPLVINLFAEYCGPCTKELPYYQRLSTRAGSSLRVIGVDYDDPDPEGALELAHGAGVTYPLLADPTHGLRLPLRASRLPIAVFVRQDGSVAAVQARAFASYAELRAAVRQQLGVTVPS